MLVPIFSIVEPPVQAAMIHTIAVPCFHNVDFAIVGPSEWLGRQEPESRPDARGARWSQCCDEAATLPAELLMADKSRTGVSRLVRRSRAVRNGTKDELVIGSVEGVGGFIGVVLGFVVSPTMLTAFVLEELRDRSRGVEVRLPVGLGGQRGWFTGRRNGRSRFAGLWDRRSVTAFCEILELCFTAI